MNTNFDNSILIIDDSKTSLMIISEYLHENYKIFMAKNVNDGIDILKNNSISLIILDLIMPDIDGYESCKMIKSIESLKDIPIIFATSKTDEESLEKAFDVGGIDYIIKPIRQQELLSRVKTHLQIHNQKRELSLKNKEINELLQKQAKMSLMGEMIANIAHQWRQPLNSINTVATSVLIKSNVKMIDRNEIEDSMNSISNKVMYLSETIDTFRNFIHDDKEIMNINIQKVLKNSIDISMIVLKDNHIQLNTQIEEGELIIKSPMGELTQVLVNLINNAKDVLIERKINKGLINISLVRNKDKAIITVEDNAGGIPEDIKDKIFDSNFTTKGKNGTGLGLHMSKQIVEDSLKGSLYCKNTQIGAKFFIILPIIN